MQKGSLFSRCCQQEVAPELASEQAQQTEQNRCGYCVTATIGARIAVDAAT